MAFKVFTDSGRLLVNNVNSGGGGGSGITTLNTLTASTQSFAIGTTGTDFTISSSGSTHTFRMPSSSSISRGLLTAANWITFNNKIGGSGTVNYVSKFTAVGTVGVSQIFDNGSLVGIGTASPTSTLHLVGTFKYVDGNQSSGYVLTSDASGNATWQAGGGGGSVISVSGTSNRITSTGGATPVIDISASYVGQSSITTLGTIATGVWSGTTITVAKGGTGNTTFTAYSVVCAGTTSTGTFQNVNGLGSSGDVLTSNGAAALPSWQPAGSSSGSIFAYVAKTANYTTIITDCTVDCTANTFTITLLTAVGNTGKIFNIKNSGTGIITIGTTSAQTIDGLTTQLLSPSDCATVQSTGLNWIIV